MARNTAPKSPLTKLRHFFWQLLVIVLVGGPLLVWGTGEISKLTEPNKFPLRQSGIQPNMAIDRSFTLTDHKGRSVTGETYATRNWLVFFGFTHCPDICPVTLSRLSSLWPQVENKDRLQLMFVTVDPERDTVEVMNDYMKAFDASFIGLTGSPVQVEQIKKNFHAYSKKVQQPGSPGYSVDHSATVYLLRADGTFAGTIDMDEPDAIVLGKLKRLAGGT